MRVAVVANPASGRGKGGKLIPGTKTETFIKMVSVPAYVPVSGKTMSFDAGGKCVSDC